MKCFPIPDLSISLLDEENQNWLLNMGEQIDEPFKDIKWFEFETADDLKRLKPILDRLPHPYSIIALVVVPPGMLSTTHRDTDYFPTRVSAINIAVQADNDRSFVDFMDGTELVQRANLKTALGLSIHAEHRVDNTAYDKRRIVLSIGFDVPVEELYRLFNPIG